MIVSPCRLTKHFHYNGIFLLPQLFSKVRCIFYTSIFVHLFTAQEGVKVSGLYVQSNPFLLDWPFGFRPSYLGRWSVLSLARTVSW